MLRVQEWSTVPPACLDADGRPPRVATLANVVPQDAVIPWRGRTFYPRIEEHAWSSVKLMTEIVAERARARLGAREGELPALGSTRQVADFRGHVYVIGRRDGTVGVMAPWEFVREDVAERTRAVYDTPGTRLLLDAVDDVVRADERFTWPERRVAADSIVFMLRWSWPDPLSRGGYGPIPFRHGAGVLPILVDFRREPTRVGRSRLLLNRSPSSRDTIVELPVTFTVDSVGQEVRGSVGVVWPASLAPVSGHAARQYASFVRDIRRDIEGARYDPAFVGRCRVATPVRQMFISANPR